MAEADFDTMRRDALRRVQEMQRRSKALVSPEEPQKPENRQRPDLLGSLLGGSGAKSKELFELAGVHIDEEKALIGMLIYILYKQGADIKLLLALGYLLL